MTQGKHEGRKSEDKFVEHTVDLSPAKEVCALPASRLLLSHPLLSSAMRFKRGREKEREKERERERIPSCEGSELEDEMSPSFHFSFCSCSENPILSLLLLIHST